jgi:FkbM family methyltransferase
MMSAVRNIGRKVLRGIGRTVPAWLPRGSGIGNRLLKPAYRSIVGCGWVRTEIWPGISMRVNPCECVGGNLFFSPQFYDRDERAWVDELLRDDHVFVDVGANLGVYSLWAARRLSSLGAVLAIEADPDTFEVLQENLVQHGGCRCRLFLENTGVSDQADTLAFYRNSSGNAGGSSFCSDSIESPSLVLKVEPLLDVIGRAGLECVDFLKIDIEGYELKVLTRFFGDCPPPLMPKYVLIEVGEGPQGSDPVYRQHLLELFAASGYRLIRSGKNALFALVVAPVR